MTTISHRVTTISHDGDAPAGVTKRLALTVVKAVLPLTVAPQSRVTTISHDDLASTPTLRHAQMGFNI